MSVRVLSKAWDVVLKPSSKVVLLALADIADDQGVCWPSMRLLAKKSCLDERAVSRTLKKLKVLGLLRVEKRFRKDGSQTSNLYVVTPSCRGGDKLPGGSDSPTGEGCHLEQAGDDLEDHPMNHQREPSQELQQPDRSGGYECLIYPSSFSASECLQAARRLHGLSPELAQDALFELAGRMKLTSVKNPLRYLGALAQSAKAGTFTPDLAQRVRENHERRVAIAESLARDDAERQATSPLPLNLDRLTPRLREIVQKHVKRVTAVD